MIFPRVLQEVKISSSFCRKSLVEIECKLVYNVLTLLLKGYFRKFRKDDQEIFLLQKYVFFLCHRNYQICRVKKKKYVLCARMFSIYFIIPQKILCSCFFRFFLFFHPNIHITMKSNKKWANKTVPHNMLLYIIMDYLDRFS